jgi:hypothetical protein
MAGLVPAIYRGTGGAQMAAISAPKVKQKRRARRQSNRRLPAHRIWNS